MLHTSSLHASCGLGYRLRMVANPSGKFRLGRLRALCRELYKGDSPLAVRFRYCVLALDLILIAFFVVTPFIQGSVAFLALDYAVAFVVALELAARAMAERSLIRWARRPSAWVDVFVLVTLLFPMWLFNLAFLRVMRLWSLVHSDFFWKTIGRRYDHTRWEDIAKAVVTLVTFVFVATGFVYSSFAGRHPQITSYLDALYFTVTALSTTGFGDVTLPGNWGKILSIVIMLSGISLFVRLAQAIVRPAKVRFSCPSCGLSRHDVDAVHCKACGVLLNIPNEE